MIRLSAALTRFCLRRILIFVCLTALLSILAGLLGIYYGEGAVEPIGVALVDADDSFESRMLTGYLLEMEEYRRLLTFRQTDLAGGQADLRAGEVSAVIVIPAGFMAGVMEGSNAPFLVTLDSASPMRAALIRTFAGVYADMLRTGQQGVYIALDAAREQGSAEQRGEMFRQANLRFLAAMLNRESLREVETVTPTGQVGVATHYAAAAFVFLILLGASLFLDVWGRALSRPILLRLSALGAGGPKAGLCFLAGASLPFGLAALLLFLLAVAAHLAFGPWFALSLPLLAALALIVLSAGAFLVAVTRLFGEGPAGGVFVFLYGLAGLFLSGGILPPAYLAPGFALAGRFIPHSHLTALLSYGLGGSLNAGALAGSAAFAAFFSLVALFGLLRDGRVGGRP